MKNEYEKLLIQKIIHYATDINYNPELSELQDLAYKAGYNDDGLRQIIKQVYDNLPIGFSIPQG